MCNVYVLYCNRKIVFAHSRYNMCVLSTAHGHNILWPQYLKTKKNKVATDKTKNIKEKKNKLMLTNF